MPTTLLLTSQIFRPSYCPAFGSHRLAQAKMVIIPRLQQLVDDRVQEVVQKLRRQNNFCSFLHKTIVKKCASQQSENRFVFFINLHNHHKQFSQNQINFSWSYILGENR